MIVKRWLRENGGGRLDSVPYIPIKNGKPLSSIVLGNGHRLFCDHDSIENQLVRGYIRDEYYTEGYWKNGGGPNKVLDHFRGRSEAPMIDVNDKSKGLNLRYRGWSEHCRPILFILNNYGSGKKLVVTSGGRTFEISNPEKYQWVRNLIPGVATYKVLSSDGSELETGTKLIKGQLRMIDLPSVQNVRDLGGWPIVDKNNVQVGRMKYNRLLRGTNLLPPTDVASIQDSIDVLVNEIGVTQQVDLQGKGTKTRAQLTCMPESVDFQSPDGSTGDYKYFFDNSYSKVFTYMKNVVEWMSDHLSASETNCTYFNCQIGRDRTGSLAAAIEALCGCEEDTIIKDWESTSFWCIDTFPRIDWPYNSGYGNWLRDWFDELYKRSGSTMSEKIKDFFVNKCEVSSAKVDALKNAMTYTFADIANVTSLKFNESSRGEYFVNNTDYQASRMYLKVNASTGKVSYDSEKKRCCTRYINVTGKKKITLTNIVGGDVAAFYDSSKQYISGESALQDGQKTISVPSGASYVVINYPYDKCCEATISASEPTANPIDWSKVTKYSGTAFMNFTYTSTITESYINSNGQGSACYGKYFVQAFNKNKYLQLYDLDTKTLLKTFTINSTTDSNWHNNSICFGVEKVSPTDEMPLLYLASNFELSDGNRTIKAYRIYQEGTVWKAELKQTIVASGFDWTEVAIDRDTSKMYIGNHTMWKFNVPTLSQGSSITINKSSALSSVTMNYNRTSTNNGYDIYNGKMIHVTGIPANLNPGATSREEGLYIFVANLETGAIEHEYCLNDLGYWDKKYSNTWEPEGSFAYNDGYYIAYRTFIARLEFSA